MSNQSNPSPFRALFLITTPKLADRASALLGQSSLPLHFRISARGTAPSEISDLLGLGNIDKTLLVGLMPKERADLVRRAFKKALRIGSVNSGICFTLPLSSMTKLILEVLSAPAPQSPQSQESLESARKDESPMTYPYSLIAAIVDPGFSEDVMEAARFAGAGGGTVLHSRQIAKEAVLSASGLSIQEEKEIVLIVAREKQKKTIMEAISQKCGMHSEAKGHVISLPIDSAIGIGDEDDE